MRKFQIIEDRQRGSNVHIIGDHKEENQKIKQNNDYN